jgi:hypothetical protein
MKIWQLTAYLEGWRTRLKLIVSFAWHDSNRP